MIACVCVCLHKLSQAQTHIHVNLYIYVCVYTHVIIYIRMTICVTIITGVCVYTIYLFFYLFICLFICLFVYLCFRACSLPFSSRCSQLILLRFLTMRPGPRSVLQQVFKRPPQFWVKSLMVRGTLTPDEQSSKPLLVDDWFGDYTTNILRIITINQ